MIRALLDTSKKIKLHICYPDTEGLGWYHAGSLAVHPESLRSYKLMSAVFVNFPIMILMSLVFIIPPPSLQLQSQSSFQCLLMDLSIGFHQVVDEGSLMTKIISFDFTLW